MKTYHLTIGSVSWIDKRFLPQIGFMYGQVYGLIFEPEWIIKTIMGLVATSNTEPPNSISDIQAFRAKKDFRALAFCSLEVVVNEKTNQIASIQIKSKIADGGFTPPVDIVAEPEFGFPVLLEPLEVKRSILDRGSYAGETSSVSSMGVKVHPNSAIAGLKNQSLICDDLIKFRAGAHTDSVGKLIGSPYHVPWVWCETALSFSHGQFTLHGRGSIFPSHAWYVNGHKVMHQYQIADNSIQFDDDQCFGNLRTAPSKGLNSTQLCIPAKGIKVAKIRTTALNIYPAISTGAPISHLQSPAKEAPRPGPIDLQSYTLRGGKSVTHSVSL